MYRRSLDAKPNCGVHARPSSDVFSKCKKPHFLIRESCMQMAFAHLGMRELRAVIFSQGTLKLLKILLKERFYLWDFDWEKSRHQTELNF